ncbi:sel1 repeat family protein [Hoeflea sp. WL0058]|uniref:Sel1 repeat family protein n=1 Tax=Flavimaribacter sediminis TaxID=2865987 RepID=A0AAE2ZSU4_9HYPH|nr:tetratricopeptide repeat protein [Flavimaribacter sediminis]MBW8640362.1 sel1 repeat family protein [Flavimaribacter sediminis]
MSLSVMYLYGAGVKQDNVSSLNWMLEAAEQNNSEAYFTLGDRYEDGEGVAADRVEGYMWYSLAIDQDHAEAALNRALLAETMTPEQISRAEAMARDWRSKHNQ